MTSTGTQAVDRAAQLLTLVVQADEPISFTELMEESGLTRSTTSRLLAALESSRLLERDQHGAFSAGALFTLYAARHDPGTEIARLADPLMQQIGAETGETVNLGVPRGDTVVQVAQVDSTYVLGVRDWMTVDVPPHASALGKVLYAYGALPLPSGPLERPTEKSLADSDALRAETRTIRRKGYAATREELEIGLHAVAVPVRGTDGAVVAALGLSGPSARLEPHLDDLARLLTHYGTALTETLRPRMRTKGVA